MLGYCERCSRRYLHRHLVSGRSAVCFGHCEDRTTVVSGKPNLFDICFLAGSWCDPILFHVRLIHTFISTFFEAPDRHKLGSEH